MGDVLCEVHGGTQAPTIIRTAELRRHASGLPIANWRVSDLNNFSSLRVHRILIMAPNEKNHTQKSSEPPKNVHRRTLWQSYTGLSLKHPRLSLYLPTSFNPSTQLYLPRRVSDYHSDSSLLLLLVFTSQTNSKLPILLRTLC